MTKIYTSPRFWLIVVAAILQILAVFNILGGEQVDKIINIITIALGGIVAVRTADKFSEPKPNVTTVSIPNNVSTVTATTEPQV